MQCLSQFKAVERAALVLVMTLECVLTHKTNDFLFLPARAGLVAYWPAPIHAVALLAYTVVT